MSLEPTPIDPALDRHADRSSPRLTVIFIVLLGLLGLFSISGTVVSAVDALLGGAAQGCGGP